MAENIFIDKYKLLNISVTIGRHHRNLRKKTHHFEEILRVIYVLYTSHRRKTIVPYTALSKIFLCNKDTGRFLLEGELLKILLIR
jgi:hypothetical protein